MSDYFFNLQILRDGQPVGAPVGLEVPFERGAEALRWRSLCAGSDDLAVSDIALTPMWDENGPPEVTAIQFCTQDDRHRVELDAHRLFAREARRTSSRLVAQKALEEGDSYTFRIAAHHRGNGSTVPPEGSFLHYEFEEGREQPSPTRLIDDHHHHEGDIEVLCEEVVLQDATYLAREAGEEEAGSILLGRLCRGTHSGDPRPFLHVTALVPADGGQRGRTSFEFTPECFNRARAVLHERQQGEVFCGWQHNHPDLCSPECPPENREVCALRKPFLSDHDLLLQENVFPAPYHVALLISDDGGELTPSLWGWRDGFMARRSFKLTNPQR